MKYFVYKTIVIFFVLGIIGCLPTNKVKISEKNKCKENEILSDNKCIFNTENSNTVTPIDFSCTGSIPANAELCFESDSNLSSDANNTLSSECSKVNKCEYRCNSNYIYSPDSNSCEPIIICGDGQINGNEVCDGNNLGTPQRTCVDEGFASGTLSCLNSCQLNLANCTEGQISGTPSELWGLNGELYDPYGWLPDFSYAGYHAGEKEIPNIAVVENMKIDYGAKGDGVTDDTQAFKNAFANMIEGTLLIPKGKYIIKEPLILSRSNIVIRGMGKGKDDTVLHFPIGLNQFIKNNNYKGKNWWSGRGGLLWVGYHNFNNATDIGNNMKEFLANITSEIKRGDRLIKVSDTTKFRVGDYVVLHLTDSTDRSFTEYIMDSHQDLSDPTIASSAGKDLAWPVKIKAINLDKNTLELQQPLRYKVLLKWKPLFKAYKPSISEVGIENLRVEFPDAQMTGAGGAGGYNGIYLANVVNSWVKNVAIINHDNAIGIISGKHNTIQGVDLLSRSAKHQVPAGEKNDLNVTAHHGFSLLWRSADNLIFNFFIQGRHGHEITVAHLAHGNVIRQGKGFDIDFDAHRNIPFSNLHTAIDVGIGKYPYSSTGNSSTFGNAHLGIYSTFWGNTGSTWDLNYNHPAAHTNYGDIKTILVPYKRNIKTDKKHWEKLDGGVYPKDIYKAQVKKRLGVCYTCD